MRRIVLGLGAAAGAALVLAACDPPPPDLAFTVDTTADLPDAAPGDGTCAATSGDCTLRAAFDEAGAWSGNDIAVTLPAGTYPLTLAGTDDTNAAGDLDLARTAGTLTIDGGPGGAVIDATGAEAGIDLATGALHLHHVAVTGASGVGVDVGAGSAVDLVGSSVHHNGGAGVRVADGGAARVRSTTLAANDTGLVNGGTAIVEAATITASTTSGLSGSGTTTLTATAVADNAIDCTTSPTSAGHNLDTDGTCALTHPTDRPDTAAGLSPLGAGPLPARTPLDGSPLLDTASPGDTLCDTPGSPTTDQAGTPRPVGPGCDTGAIEADFALAFTVDAPDDTRDATPGDGTCADAAGHCTLRAAIDETNTEPRTAAHRITLAVDPVLTRPGADDDTNRRGDLDVLTPLTIDGAGHAVTQTVTDRVVDQHGGTLTLAHVAVTGGFVQPLGGFGDGSGGGILVRSGSTTLLDDVHLHDNLAAAGGGPADTATGGGLSVEADATVEVRGSVLEANNAAIGDSDGGGGGAATAGDLTVRDSVVRANRVGRSDIGAALAALPGGHLLVERTDVVDNTAVNGFRPPAISARDAQTEILATHVTAADDGVVVSRGTLVVDASTIESGGVAIRATEAGTALSRSTVTGRRGVWATSGDTAVSYSTVIGRQAALAGTDIEVAASILDGTVDDACVGGIASSGGNVASDTTCGLDGPLDVEGVDPQLGALADNGGPTPTALPAAGSPAIDRIPDGWAGLCEPIVLDQRGVVRPDPAGPGAGCDAGAVEGAGPPPGTRTFVVGTPDDAPDAAPDGACDDGAGRCTLRAALAEAGTTIADDTVQIAPGVDPVITAGPVTSGGFVVLDGDGATLSGTGTLLSPTHGRLVVRDLTLLRTAPSSSAVLSAAGDVDIEASTIVAGGGPAISTARSASLTASTVTGTTGTVPAIRSTGDPVVVTASTLVSAGSPLLSGAPGAVLTSSILSGAPGVGVCASGTFTSGGGNVVSDATCGADAAHDLEGADPQLAPLDDNGGPTPTHLPASTSPAIDRVPVGGPPACAGAVDQRGVSRPVGSGCDSGAVEGAGAPLAGVDLVVDTAADGVDSVPGDGTCAAPAGCTLRAAIDEANASPGTDHIVIAGGVAPALTLAGADDDLNASGDLDVRGDLTIDGGGATVDGSDLDRVLDIRQGAVVLRDLTVTGGQVTGNGGGVQALGALTTVDVRVAGNQATGSGGGIASWVGANLSTTVVEANTAGLSGGGIASDDLVLDRSILATNTATSSGGGVSVSGALRISGSTIAGNSAERGGGIWSSLDPVTIERSTLSGNTATLRGAALDATGATNTLTATTVVGNHGPSSLAGDTTMTATVVDHGGVGDACDDRDVPPGSSGGWNIDDDGSCHLDAATDATAAAAVGALGSNGGPTPTHLPVATSPLLDVIPVGTPGLCDSGATDQRGTVRPVGTACDIGAVEGSGAPDGALDLLVDSPLDVADLHPGDGVCDIGSGLCTLRAAITETDIRTTADTIRIASGVDPVLTIGGTSEQFNQWGDLDVSGDLTIEGGGATVDGGRLDAVFDHHEGRLVLRDLTVTNGNFSGAIHTRGTVVLERTRVVANDSALTAAVNGPRVVMRDSVVSGNRSLTGTAGVDATEVDIRRSTISGNVGSGVLRATTGVVENSTISGNRSPYHPTISKFPSSPRRLVVLATTVSGNETTTATSGRIEVGASVLDPWVGAACDGAVESLGGNVVGDLSCDTGPGDRRGDDPAVGALADHGGPTPTQVPYLTSPALGAVGAAACPTTDQRGIARPSGAPCTAGAVEGGNGLSPTPRSFVVDVATDGHDVAPGDGACDDGTGHCPLRAAVDEVNVWPGADAITIAPGVAPALSLPGDGEIDADTDVDVDDPVVVSGGGAVAGPTERVLDVLRDRTDLDGVTLHSGARVSTPGELHVTSSVVQGGGGIDVRGAVVVPQQLPDGPWTATITESTVSGSTSSGVDVWGEAEVLVDRSTIAGNSATRGGGILTDDGARVHVVQSTVSGNTAASGSAIAADGPRGMWVFCGSGICLDPSVRLLATTVVAGPGGAAIEADVQFPAQWMCDLTCVGGGSVVSVEGSALDAASTVCGTHTQLVAVTGSVASDGSCPGAVDAGGPLGLGALGANGGPTDTHLPLAGSPVIDAVGDPRGCGLDVDQRGAPRPVGTACDAGSVETTPGVSPLAVTVDAAVDSPDALAGDGICADTAGRCTLRAAVDETNAVPGADVVTIAPGVAPVLSLTGADDTNARGDLDVTDDLVIEGGGATVSAASIDRVLDHHAGYLELRDLTVRDGRLTTAGDAGAGIRSGADLVLDGVTVRSNRIAASNGSGAGVASTAGTLVLRGSTVTQNTLGATGSTGGTGAGLSTSGAVTIDGSAVSSNTGVGSGWQGGGIAVLSGTATVRSSTVSGNVLPGFSGRGGGVAVIAGSLVVERSTISSNTAFGGSAVDRPLEAGTVTIRRSTIHANTGLYSIATAELTGAIPAVTVEASILSATNAVCSRQLGSSGWNLVTDDSCVLTAATDLESVAAGLGPLAANGGPTLTHLPAPGSAALDVIPAGTPGVCDAATGEDQRGFARPAGAGCDIGAVEQ